jgi:hypothetical protein
MINAQAAANTACWRANSKQQATKDHGSSSSFQNGARLDHWESRGEGFFRPAATRFGIQAKLGSQLPWAAGP